ncbi:hypothetical protein AOQ71_30600 [Bradyrhizobium manausense]|uniref:Uncharacterized protein n=1 Tax=Bradyrhizobium manausense TaxID=989370 RepID=A0A0R3D5W4_9BRAD|nr:hypothetical protein AOQ71_30600 [Bradyrhizobium manausense]
MLRKSLGADSKFNALRGTTNRSRQHGSNTLIRFPFTNAATLLPAMIASGAVAILRTNDWQ